MWIKIVIMLGIVATLGFGYMFIQNLVEDNKQLAIKVNKLNTNIQVLGVINKKINTNYETSSYNIEKVNKEISALRSSKVDLEKRLAKHDLQKLSVQKPGLITNRINRATARVFQRIEAASGNSSSP